MMKPYFRMRENLHMINDLFAQHRRPNTLWDEPISSLTKQKARKTGNDRKENIEQQRKANWYARADETQ